MAKSRGAEKVKVDIDGVTYSNWVKYEINSDIMATSGTFSLMTKNKDAELTGTFQFGQLVKIYIDDQLQMLGYVDDIDYDTDPDEGCTIEISGRDLFGQLEDCSALPKNYTSITLQDLATALTEQWTNLWWLITHQAEYVTYVERVVATLPNFADITVEKAQSTDRIPRVKVEPGETVYEVLKRIAEKERMHLWMSPGGIGIIGKPNYSSTPLYNLYMYKGSNDNRAKNNIQRAQVKDSWRDRFSRISVSGSRGNNANDYADKSVSNFSSEDSEISTTRILILTDGDVKNHTQAKNKAEEEVAKRKFEGLTLDYTVKGHYGSGKNGFFLYQIDTLADVDDEVSGQYGTFYVKRRRFYGDSSGKHTDLTLVRKGLWLA